MQKNYLRIFQSIYDKNLNKVGIEQTYFTIIKPIYDRPTANIILSGKNISL